MKGIAILSATSPLFDAFWPIIYEVADPQTRNSLALVDKYFQKLAKLAEAREISAALKAQQLHQIRRKYPQPPNPLRLDPMSNSPLWYAWGADKAGFEGPAEFEDFCKIAGIDPSEGVAWFMFGPEDPSWSFLSSTGDLSCVCSLDPRNNGYVHYFGCTGEREKALKLEEWFSEHGIWEEICSGDREFI